MNKFKMLALVFVVFATLSACSDGTSTTATPAGILNALSNGTSTTTTTASEGNLGALSCDGARTWDFGVSDVLQGADTLISESSGQPLSNTKFPCTIFWEYSASFNCSLGGTYEDYLTAFGLSDFLQEVGTLGANLVVVGTGADRQTGTGTPANISVIDLINLPDCELQ